MAAVREYGCLVCGRPSNAHHVRTEEKGGMSLKVSDYLTVPLCAICHGNLHTFGHEQTWWDVQGIDPYAWIEKHRKEYDEHNQTV